MRSLRRHFLRNNILIAKHLIGLKKPAGVFLFCMALNLGIGQTNKKLTICFDPVFGKNTPVIMDSVYFMDDKNTVKFETLKFYISNIQLFNNSELVWREKKSFHLCGTDSSNKNIYLNIPVSKEFTRLTFNLGIDSITNVSGALGGDLDPTKGMYWTWQSGYVNFKLEGKSEKSKDPKKEFQFHLGGYSGLNKAVQTITLNCVYKKKIGIDIDLKQFINSTDLAKQHHVMSPGEAAVILSQLAAKCFSTQ